MAEENIFLKYAEQLKEQTKDSGFASNRKADFGTNLATKLLAASQVPTTLANQLTLGEPLDPMRETSGAEVIKKLQEKPLLERFTGPSIGGLVANPFLEYAKTVYQNIPAGLSAITPAIPEAAKPAIEQAARNAASSLPLIPKAVTDVTGTVAGKIIANPEIATGLVSDVVRDPLNAVAPVMKATGAGKAIGQAAQSAGFKLSEMIPTSAKQALEKTKKALETRFVPPIQRVEKGVRRTYDEAIGTKNLNERTILEEANNNISKLKDVYRSAGKPETLDPEILDLIEVPNYKGHKALAVANEPDAWAKLNSFVSSFKANRQAEREALQKAGIHVGELKGIDYASHVMTKEAKDILGEQGATKLGLNKAFDLNDPSLYQRSFVHPDGKAMRINEVNELFRKGEMPGFEGKVVPKFFETDPVLLDAIAKTRTSKILAEKEFYEGLKQFAKKDGVEVSARLMGKELLGGYRFDPEVKELLENAKNYIFTDEISNTYDKITNVWKSLVTASPQFHARNAFSNVISNAAEGLVNPQWYATAAKIQKGESGVIKTLANGRDITYKEVRDIATKYGLDKGFISSETAQGLKETLYPAKNPIAASRKIGSEIEANAKLAHLAWALDKGMSIEEAVNSVKKTLFDYSELTNYERQVMKRTLPFYTWLRKNAPRQVEIAVTKPHVNSKLAIARSNIESAEPLNERQQEAKPDYFDELLAIHLGKTPDKKNLFFSVGLPQVDLTRFKMDPDKSLTDNVLDTAGQFVGDLNPFVKMGLEAVFNKQTMDPTRELTVDKEKQLVPVPDWIGLVPDSIQSLLGVREMPKTKTLVMPKAVAIVVNNLASIPQLRLAGKLGAERLTDEDKAFAIMSFVTGIKFIPEDLKKDAIRRHKQLMTERRNKRSDAKRFKEVGDE